MGSTAECARASLEPPPSRNPLDHWFTLSIKLNYQFLSIILTLNICIMLTNVEGL